MIDGSILNNKFFVTEVRVNMMCSIKRNARYWSMFSSLSVKVVLFQLPVTTHNNRQWRLDNPRMVYKLLFLDIKVNEWCALSVTQTIWPTLFSDTINSEKMQWTSSCCIFWKSKFCYKEIDFFQQGGATALTIFQEAPYGGLFWEMNTKVILYGLLILLCWHNVQQSEVERQCW